MMTSLSHGEDGELSDTLAGVLGRLQGHSYGRPWGEPEENVHLEADGFVDRLASHFRHVEETIIPALRKGGSASASEIEELQKDHRLLGLFARDLANRIGQKDKEGAYRVARSFLALLLEHLRRERSDRIEGD